MRSIASLCVQACPNHSKRAIFRLLMSHDYTTFNHALATKRRYYTLRHNRSPYNSPNELKVSNFGITS